MAETVARQSGVPVREYRDAQDMLKAARERQARFFPQSVVVVARPAPPGEGGRASVVQRATPRRDWLNLASATSLKRPTWRDILTTVVDATGITAGELLGQCRVARIARPRQILFWLLRRHAGLSLPAIGRRIGDRDHTTVLHGCRRVEAMMAADPAFKGLVSSLSDEIMARAEP